MAKSSAAVVAIGVGMVFYIALHGHRREALLLLLFGVLYLLIDKPDTTRFDAWKQGWEFYKQHWILGSGIGHWKVVFLQFKHLTRGVWYAQAHSDILQGFFEMGILFGVLLLGYLGDIYRKVRCSLSEHTLPVMALIIILFEASLNFMMHIATTAMVAITWMAILSVELKKDEKCLQEKLI